MLPIPTEWWLRPLSSAARVGAHSAVVWNRLYVSPPAASRSAVGVWHGPPNALDAPKPTSSSRTTSTFGAPSGGSSGSIGGKAVSGSFASYVVSPACGRSGIGNIVRAWRSGVMASFHRARPGRRPSNLFEQRRRAASPGPGSRCRTGSSMIAR